MVRVSGLFAVSFLTVLSLKSAFALYSISYPVAEPFCAQSIKKPLKRVSSFCICCFAGSISKLFFISPVYEPVPVIVTSTVPTFVFAE